MATSDSCKIEGWLVKKRGDYHKSKFFHYDSMRWFKLQEVNVRQLPTSLIGL